jgi:heat-inducible transcriptional repressor
MDERKMALLSQIIDEYVTRAQAVGSKMIVDKYDWEVSPATIRNEMAELEEEGYMTHMHTSAGRQPTEKGYRWYVESLDQKKCVLSSRIENRLSSSIQKLIGIDEQDKVKQLAKAIAEIASNAVVIGFGKSNAYYTGLSYLFNQPEFENRELVKSFSEILDQLDEALNLILEDAKDEEVKVGSENPFGVECSFVSCKIPRSNYLFGILGPLRMDYKRNIGLVRWVRENV